MGKNLRRKNMVRWKRIDGIQMSLGFSCFDPGGL